MLGRRDRRQEDLFVTCPMSELVPDDYLLKKVDRVLDLSWLRDEVRDCYCLDNGRPGIDPEAAVRLMLAGLLHGIVKDRALMREARMHLGIRWFAGYTLDEPLPHHSSLTRIRQRWGPERFERILQRTVEACQAAGLVPGQTVHVDATLVRADVSWESLTTGHVREVVRQNGVGHDDTVADTDKDEPTDNKPLDNDPTDNKPSDDEPTDDKPSDDEPTENEPTRDEPSDDDRPRLSATGKPKKISRTDPEATLTTNKNSNRMEPSYKQHTAVDSASGVILDVAVTTGEASEGEFLIEQLERIERAAGRRPSVLTADAGYAHTANFHRLEQLDIEAIVPTPREAAPRTGRLPRRRFKYDAKHDIVRCPRKKILRPGARSKNGRIYRARSSDCRRCPLRDRCISTTAKARTVRVVDHAPALLRARRRRARWGPREWAIYNRHRGLVEGRHGEAKTQHGLARAARRGLDNMRIQATLTAAAMNLKRLAAALTTNIGPNRLSEFVDKLIRALLTAVGVLKPIIERSSRQKSAEARSAA